jgi:hypothetical protein
MGEVFRNHYPFFVPKYQRGYAWEAEEVADFINDVKSLIVRAKPRSPHFMGGMVNVYIPFANSVSRRHEVVDGQQRMATVSLAMSNIMSGLSNLASRSTDPAISGACAAKRVEIREAFLDYKETQGANRVYVPKLQLSRRDEFFFRTLFSDTTAAPSRESHRRLQYAYEAINRELVEPIIGGAGTDTDIFEALVELYKTISEDCVVIHVVSQNRSEAYRLFSVLNDRGRNLTDGDLLRALTLELLESDPVVQDTVEHLWDDILDGTAEEITKYLKAFFPSVTGRRAPNNHLFDTYQKEFLHTRTAASIRDFVSALADNKPAFFAILQGEWPFSSASTATAWDRDRLHRLVNVLRHEAAHPLLLSAVKIGEAKFTQDVRLLERLVFRYITIVGAHPSPLYGPYYAEAKRMRDRPRTYQVRSLHNQLAALIAARAPDHSFGTNLVAKLEYSDNTVRKREIRHFLSTLESYRRWYERGPRRRYPPTPDTMTVFDVAAITLEHIYPDNTPAGHQDSAMELVKHCLANLTIMAASDNSVIGNANFAAKKAEFARSGVGLTRRLDSFANWTTAEFQTRENELVQMALAVFNIP